MNRFHPLFLALLLAACASGPKSASLEDGLRALIGRPATEARAVLGDPDTIRPQGATMLYIWTAKQPHPSDEKANDRGRQIAAALRQNPNAVAQPSSCQLTMTVTAGDIVASAHLTGDPARCGSFARAFAGGN